MRHESVRSRRHRWNTWLRWVILVSVLVALGLLVGSSSAKAAPQDAGLPGIDICAQNAPFARTPEAGLAGLLGERPIKITTDDSPEHIWSTGGFAGLRANTYDLGCAVDPTSWMRVANASSDAKVSNLILSMGDAIVSVTDSVDRRSWQPGWVVSFLEDFAGRSVGIINTTIIGPFLVVGVIIAIALLLFRAHHGDLGSAATNTGWIFVVITVSALLITSPLLAAKFSQAGAGTVVAALNNSSDPSDGATNQIVKNVEYQGWLRRNFGSTESSSGETYGPRLLASTRISWAELDAIMAKPKKERPEAMEKLTDAKAKQFKDVAAKIKDVDKGAYRHLTGEESGSVETLVELAFVSASCFFRLATAILMITCTITLGLLAIIWLVLTPIIVQPRFGRQSGQDIGMGIVNSAVRATTYVLAAAVGSWLFGVYLQACMAPGMSLWWSLLLLILGSGIAWTIIRPDRKFLSIVSLGRVDGYGYVGNMLKTFVMAYVGGRIAGRAVANSIEDDETPAVQQERLSEDVQTPARTVHANIYTPTQPFVPEQPTHVDGEPIMGQVVHALPSGAPAYQRPTGEAPAPPVDSAESPYQPYQRTDDNEGART